MESEVYRGVVIISGDYDRERAFVESLGWTIKAEEQRAGETHFEVEGPPTAVSLTEEHPNRLIFTRNFRRSDLEEDQSQAQQLGTY